MATVAPKRGGQVIDSSSHGETEPKTEAEISPRVTVRIQGALVLPPEVYLDILKLPPKATATSKTAALLRKQVLTFLRRTGFELATVKARVANGAVTLEVDEGQIERVLFLGPLSYQLLRFKLSLELPNDVFNRAHFDQQVRELSEELNVPGVRWELVRTAPVKHVGPQVVETSNADDDGIGSEWAFRARRPYEVRVFFPEDSIGTTLGAAVRTDFLDGLQLGLINPARDVLSRGDLLRIEGMGGAGLRSSIDSGGLYPHFSRAFLGLIYDTPPVLNGLRAGLSFDGTWLSRQRQDLNLEDYNALIGTAAVQLQYDLFSALRIHAGVGLEWRRFFGFQASATGPVPPSVQISNRFRQFFQFAQEWVVDPRVLRWDRRHALESEVRLYLASASQPSMGWVDARYQYVKELGWNDLLVRSRGRYSWGEVTFHDEISTGEYLRSLYGHQFVRSAANLQLEFRLSIARDLLKVSLFHDLALLGEPSRVDNSLKVLLANGFGPGVHLLLFDMFQVDSYMAFGFRQGSRFGAAFSLLIGKAF
jgi:hypothetical protein